MKKVFSFLFVFSITTVHSFYVTGIGVAEQQTEEAAPTSYIPNFATEIRAIEGALEKAPVVSLATLKDTLNQSSSLE